jgi:hypothetical protein
VFRIGDIVVPRDHHVVSCWNKRADDERYDTGQPVAALGILDSASVYFVIDVYRDHEYPNNESNDGVWLYVMGTGFSVCCVYAGGGIVRV